MGINKKITKIKVTGQPNLIIANVIEGAVEGGNMNLATLNLRREGTKDEIIEYLVDTRSEVSVIKKGKLRGDKMCRVSHIPLSGIGAGVVTTRDGKR
jgi:hypothetical protein